MTDAGKEKKPEKEEVRQVFQGKYMRENASFFEILFYTYPKPLLDSALTQQIRFEQYGDLPDRLKICYEEEKIEKSI